MKWLFQSKIGKTSITERGTQNFWIFKPEMIRSRRQSWTYNKKYPNILSSSWEAISIYFERVIPESNLTLKNNFRVSYYQILLTIEFQYIFFIFFAKYIFLNAWQNIWSIFHSSVSSQCLSVLTWVHIVKILGLKGQW